MFVPHPNFRFGTEHLKKIGNEIVYVCESPMFDDMIGDEHINKFEIKIHEELKDFDPELDVVADYGDALIFAMIIFHLAEYFHAIKIARFSTKKDTYVIREISSDNFFEEQADQ